MADETKVGSVEMQKTLGLTGLTMNAMALIAPGAFLWLTFFSVLRPPSVTPNCRSSIPAREAPTTSPNSRS